MQQESLYRIEVAYTAALTQADRVLAQWQKRVSGGKQVGRFAQRVSALLESLSAEFERKTAGSALVKERSERLRALQDYTLTSAGRLSLLQLSALEAQAAALFQKQLLQILREAAGPATEGDAAAEVKSAQDQALRRSLFWFASSLTEMRCVRLVA